ncbi:MAG: Rrf2 family transcriptional regulator [Planctomycetota bacterium]
MLTQTTEAAIRVMIFLASQPANGPVSVRQIGEAVGGSSTYLAKVLRDLVKARLLESYRGAAGGVVLALPPESITLRAIVEAAQGPLIESYCRSLAAVPNTCAFHRAMHEIRAATLDVLARCTLADLALPCEVGPQCKMFLGSPDQPVEGPVRSGRARPVGSKHRRSGAS